MRRALLLFPVFVYDPFDRHFYVSSVRFHDLDRLSHGELVPLLDPAQSVFRPADDPKISIVLHISVAVIDLCVIVRLSEKESGREFPVGAVGNLIQIPWHILPVKLRILLIIIDRLPVGPRHCCDIEGSLHPPFDLQAVDARVDQLRDMLDHAQVLGIENVGPPLILIDRHIFAGSGLFHHSILPSARMGAGAPVGVTAREIITQKAPPGIGNAHCPMDKCLDLQIFRDIRTEFLQFLHRELPR